VEEEVEEGATAVVVKETTEEDAQEEEEEEITTPEPPQRPRSTGVYALPSETMSSTMVRREQQTRCVQLGRRSYTTSEQYTDTVLASNELQNRTTVAIIEPTYTQQVLVEIQYLAPLSSAIALL
jgi:hypothetical protein